MIEEKLGLLTAYFEEQITLCYQRRDTLLADDRGDEADFERIKANVFDIFRTILSVAFKSCKGDSDAIRKFFLIKTEQIPTNWAASYVKAKQHDDVEKMQIESIKLDTLQGIKEMFVKIWEGEA